MNQTYLVLDCNYLTRRAQHTFHDLEYNGQPTGVIYGFLRELRTLLDQFPGGRFVFCWDHGPSLRAEQYPAYKAHRRAKTLQLTAEERDTELVYQKQVVQLKDCYLAELGYRNICYQWGYEADDLIASVCQSTLVEHKVVIVGCDKDLYQCLDGDRVIMWLSQRKRTYTEYDLDAEYFGCSPRLWAKVKALAGCPGDGVIGIKGVGDKTAAKFVTGRLANQNRSRLYDQISREVVKGIYETNLPLVQLPYAGTKTPILRLDEVTNQKWKILSHRLGFRSLLGGLF